MNDQKNVNPILDPDDRPVWGARAIGALIGKKEKAAFYLLEKKAIPATKVAGIWTSTPRRLRNFFAGEVS